MNKRNVLYLGNFSLKNFAATNRALEILSLLDQLGFNLHLSFYGDGASSYEESSPVMKKVVVHRLSFKKIKFYYSYKDAFNLIKKIPDLSLVILYNYPAIPSIHILKLCKKKSIKVIGDISEWYDTSNISFLLKPIKKIDTSMRMRSVNKKLDGMVVISDYLQKFYYDKNTIKIYPLFDDSNHQEPRKKQIEYDFGYAGVAGKRKDDLVGFLDELTKVDFLNGSFLLIGDVNKKILSRFDDLNVKYKYVGRLPHKETIDNLLKCRCQVIFRKGNRMNNAGFPTKFAESVCLGIPIICNDFSDLNKFESDKIYKIGHSTKAINDFLDSASKKDVYEDNVLKVFKPSSYIKAFSEFIDKVLSK